MDDLPDDLVPIKESRRLFTTVPSNQTVRRWITHGVFIRGSKERVKLKGYQIGGQKMVSRRDAEAFIQALSRNEE